MSPAQNAPAATREDSQSIHAFTLTEIVLALAIISTAMVALIGLLPVGIDASKQAGSHTVVSGVLVDLHERLLGERLKPGPVPFSPAFYDASGAFLSPEVEADETAKPYYRADVQVLTPASAPEHTSGLRPVKVDLYWPVDEKTGEPIRNAKPKTTVTYNVTPLTGPDWTRIDTRYVPTIEY